MTLRLSVDRGALDGDGHVFDAAGEAGCPCAAIRDRVLAGACEPVDLELEDPTPVVTPRRQRRVVVALLVVVGEIALGRHRPHRLIIGDRPTVGIRESTHSDRGQSLDRGEGVCARLVDADHRDDPG